MNESKPGRQLFKCSLRILNENRKLLLFALPYLGAMLVLLLIYLAPVLPEMGHLVDKNFNEFESANHAWAGIIAAHPSLYFWFFMLNLLVVFAATFLNVALSNEIFRIMDGEKASICNGLRFASQKLKYIAWWTLLICTVGLLFDLLRRRLNWTGKLAVTLAGMTWNMAAQFVVPALAREENGHPLELLRKSANVLRRNPGKAFAGLVGFNYGFMAMSLAFVLFIFIPFVVVIGVAAISQQFWIIMAGLAVIGLALGTLAVFTGLARDIYLCALYVYAAEGVVPEPFTPELLDAAWKIRKE